MCKEREEIRGSFHRYAHNKVFLKCKEFQEPVGGFKVTAAYEQLYPHFFTAINSHTTFSSVSWNI